MTERKMLEQAIEKNTEAIEKLTAMLLASGVLAARPEAPPTPTEKPKTPPAPKAAAPKPTPEPAVTEPVVAEGAEPVDYNKDVKPLLLKVSQAKGRDALLALLTKFGAKNGSDLKAEQLGDVKAAALVELGS
jgi:hypothetical protein